MKYILSFLISSILITSCIPGESVVKPYDRGDVRSASASMGHFYAEQLYYSFESNSILRQNVITDWDLGFACADEDFEIIMNFGKFMNLAIVEDVSFESIDRTYADSIPEELWKFDNSNGFKDSTAVGNWWTNDNGKIESKLFTYVIDRGLDEKAKKQGMAKLQITKFENNTYFIKFADLKNNIINEIEIPKDNQFNYVQLSLTGTGSVLSLEPNKNSWDLLFSKYSELVYTSEGDGIWYSVTGAYLNPNTVEGAVLDEPEFSLIDNETLNTVQLVKNRNIIGHDWKYYDLESSSYYVNSKRSYIVKGVQGFYYKMHFIDFYDESGTRGVPKFEFQKL